MKTAIKNIETAGGEIAYRVKGSTGDTGIVFIHGLGADSRFFQKQLHYFGGFMKSVAVDLPGHGHSGRGAALSMEALSDSVLAVIEAENLRNVVLAGHSLGGAVALDISLRAVHPVEAMVLISTGARIPVAESLEKLLEGDPAEFYRILVRAVFSRKGDLMVSMAEKNFHLLDGELFKESFALCRGLDYSPHLHSISVPVLAVANDGDKLVVPEITRELAEGIPGAEFILFDAGGHVPFFEYAQLFDAEMERFLRKNVPAFISTRALSRKKALN